MVLSSYLGMASIELYSPHDSCADMSRHPSDACLLPLLGRPKESDRRAHAGVQYSGGNINSLNRRAHHRDTSSASRSGLLHCATAA